MAPKNKFTKEDLIETAFDIACVDGFDSITIRKIADKLGCSIAPIYVNYKDVSELKNDVVKKAIEICKELISQQNSGDQFLDIGIASVLFAKRYPLLYDELVIKNRISTLDLIDASNFIFENIKTHPDLQGFDEQQIRLLMIKMQAFQSGLAFMARKEAYSQLLSEEKIIEILKETGSDLFEAMVKRAKRSLKT